jgi:hypothetical protein
MMRDDDVLGDILEAWRDEAVMSRGWFGSRLWLVRQLGSWLVWRIRRELVRRLRLGLEWVVLWCAVWGAAGVSIETRHPGSVDPGEELAMIKILGLIGLASGTIFTVLLAAFERGDVSPGRAALWGILSAAAIPLLAGKPDQVFTFAPVGMLIALALATFRLRASRN